MADALEEPFRRALVSLYRYQYQVSEEAKGAAGNASPGTKLRPTPGTSQMVYSYEHQLATLRAQLLRLLGREGLKEWEQNIIRDVKRQVRRELEQGVQARDSDSEGVPSPTKLQLPPEAEGKEGHDSVYDDGASGVKRKAITSPRTPSNHRCRG